MYSIQRLRPTKLAFIPQKLHLVNTEFSHRSLLRVINTRRGCRLNLLENELLVQHLSHFLAKLLPESINQDLLRLNLDHTHQHFVQDKHTLREHSDLVSPLCQLVSLLRLRCIPQHIFTDSCFQLCDLLR